MLIKPIQLGGIFFVIWLAAFFASSAGEAQNEFHPGKVWLDDHGVPINAHGGGILFHEGTYYWFGEQKVGGERGNQAWVGVHVYASTNLYAWKDAGIALTQTESGRVALDVGLSLGSSGNKWLTTEVESGSFNSDWPCPDCVTEDV